MNQSLTDSQLTALVDRIVADDRRFQEIYPGESGRRQPVHTVYGGAQLFRADSATKLGALGRRALETYAPDAATFARVLEIPAFGAGGTAGTRARELAETVFARVRDKLEREPVEDFRIDFEDGYGNRPDADEDAEAVRTAGEVARGMKEGILPPYLGIRIKPFTAELGRRGLRTLDLFVTALLTETGGALPDNFVVTFPKVTRRAQVEALVAAFGHLEAATGLPSGALKLELMIEMPQAILSADGGSNLPRLLAGADGRAVAAHFGTYDYTAGAGITAAHQHMMHPVCDFAKHMMQVAYAGTGIWISDGATNVMPVGPHVGKDLTDAQKRENTEGVHRAWRLHATHVRHSLENGFYQGWDLHPAQLPTRYGAVYAFFLAGLDAAAERLKNFVDKAAQATLVGDVFDDAATGQGLLNYFIRATGCGAIGEEEAVERSGLTLEELRGRSFAKIVEGRRQG